MLPMMILTVKACTCVETVIKLPLRPEKKYPIERRTQIQRKLNYSMPLYNENVRVFRGEIGDEDGAVMQAGPAEQPPDAQADLPVGLAPFAELFADYKQQVFRGEIGDEDEAVLQAGPAKQAPVARTDMHAGPVADHPPPEDDQHIGATPSKVRKLSGEAVESPSDKLSVRQIRIKKPIRKSIKFNFQEAVTDNVTGEITLCESTVVKVYTS